MSNPRPRFRLLLEALPCPDGPSADRRLAQALKHLLRAQRLRCVQVEDVTPEAEDQEEAAAAITDPKA